MCYCEIAVLYSFNMKSGVMNIYCGILADLHTFTQTDEIQHPSLRLCVSCAHADGYVSDLYSQRVCSSDINVTPFSVLFPHREQRGVQETVAVNHIHCHGDQPPGNPVHGPLLPQ